MGVTVAVKDCDIVEVRLVVRVGDSDALLVKVGVTDDVMDWDGVCDGKATYPQDVPSCVVQLSWAPVRLKGEKGHTTVALPCDVGCAS